MSADLLKDSQTTRITSHDPNKPYDDFDVFYRHQSAQVEDMFVIDQTPNLHSTWPIRYVVLEGTCNLRVISRNGNSCQQLNPGEAGVIQPSDDVRFSTFGSVPCRIEITTLTPED